MTITNAPNPVETSRLVEEAEQRYGQQEKLRGAVFTKNSVVDFMLDLIGYTRDRPLHEMSLLEPSFGGGRFVLSAVGRLIDAWRSSGGTDASDLIDSVRAVELDAETYEAFGVELRRLLVRRGLSEEAARQLAESWLVRDDFLLTNLPLEFNFIVGNPPYVRQELVPNTLLTIYRAKYPTMIGRADLYVAFIERSLDLLAADGKMSFICADAWVKNAYGRGLRQKISTAFHLEHYVDMYGLNAFEVQVGAYTSITVISHGAANAIRVAKAESVERGYLRALSSSLLDKDSETCGAKTVNVISGGAPWLLSANMSVDVIRRLEARFPTIVDAGCRVGIGVATGADKVFIAPFDELDVEDDRKVPLATNKAVLGGVLSWTGQGVVNPWQDEGGLVDLSQYPRLAAHLEPFREQLGRRHTAKSDVARRWYKTIDRITPSLAYEPKLLIPDIKGNGDAIAYDPGSLYPHHNLYFIVSKTWNLRALQALLRSGIAHLFVEAYSVRLGGGYLRFQAQNLKRIRVPVWENIVPADQAIMTAAGERGHKLSSTMLERIYQLDEGTLAFLDEDNLVD